MIETRPELKNISDYVPGKSIEEICEQYGLQSAVKLASNENPLGPSPKAQKAFCEMASSLHLYPRGNAPHLISAIAAKFGVPKNQIVLGNGSDEIIDMVGKAFLQPGDECLGISTTFSVYRATAILYGAKYVSVSQSPERPSLDAYLQAVTPKTRMVFICNPNNPTGFYYSEKELLDFLAKLPRDILVFLDEAYLDFATAADFPNLISQMESHPNLILNRTFSKIYGLAGIRIGFAFASPEVSAAIWKVKPAFNVNIAAQAAAEAALLDDEHIRLSLEVTEAGKAFLTSHLEKLGFVVLPTQANFLCIKIGEKCKELVEYLERNGMIVRHLKSFSLPEWIRVTIGKPEENQLFVDLVQKWKAL